MFIHQSKFGNQLLLVGFCMMLGFTVQGQPDEIVTDRPDQTESALVVGKRVLQIETGVVFSKMDLIYYSPEAILRTRDYATTLIRYGIHERIELRLASAYTEWDFSDSTQTYSGLQPVSIGAKFALAKEKGIWPEIAFLGHLTLPWVGAELFVPDHIAPDFRFSLSHTLSQRFSLGYNLGMDWGDCCPVMFYSISLGVALFGPVSVFVESYGDPGTFLKQVDFGLTVLISPDLQFDIAHGFSFHDAENPQFLNMGISARFDGNNKD